MINRRLHLRKGSFPALLTTSRRALVRAVTPGYTDTAARRDLRAALEPADTGDTSDCEDCDDNDKIYGVPAPGPALQCDQCARTFLNTGSLKRHQKQHVEQNYSCNECGQRFAFLEDLRIHREGHHQDDMDMYVGKDDTNVDSTQSNETQMSGAGVHTVHSGYVRCKLCLKVMKRESYTTHKLLHKNESKIVCSFCARKFRKHEHLKKHITKAHRNNTSKSSLDSFFEESIYNCTICKKTFQTGANLSNHMTVHFTNEIKQHIPNISRTQINFTQPIDMEDHTKEMHENTDASHYLPMK